MAISLLSCVEYAVDLIVSAQNTTIPSNQERSVTIVFKQILFPKSNTKESLTKNSVTE